MGNALGGTELHSHAGCSLSADDLPGRLAAWRRLAVQALSRKEGVGWVVSAYPASSETEVRSLIQAEAQCCPFLQFEVTHRGAFVEVRLEFPPEFAPMLAAIIPAAPTQAAKTEVGL